MSRWLIANVLHRFADKNESPEEIVNKLIEEGDYVDLHNFLMDQKITKEDNKELFYKAVNKLIEEKFSMGLFYEIRKKLITKEDGELYIKVLDTILLDEEFGVDLLKDKIITKEDDRELYTEILNKLIKRVSSKKLWTLINHDIITKEDGELFYKAVNRLIANDSLDLLEYKVITREDGKFFDRAVDTAIVQGKSPHMIAWNIVTKEDGDLFYKVLNEAYRADQDYIERLIKNGTITKEDASRIWSRM